MTVLYLKLKLLKQMVTMQFSWLALIKAKTLTKLTRLKEKYLQILIENRKEFIESPIVNENLELLSHPVALSHGIQFKNLISKIMSEGFNHRYPRPGIFILKNQNNRRWVMGGNGNHRAYIMSTLEQPSLPVSVIKVVDRSKSSQWNNVLNGNYTKREAEEV